MIQAFVAFALIWIALGSLAGIVVGRKTFASLWREPMLNRPVLIVESDDWGAGPVAQAAQLDRIAEVLASHGNRLGQKPVMTLGVVLSGPDGGRILGERLRRFYRKSLTDASFSPVLESMRRGVAAGVFALQLHAEEHYWPDAVLAASSKDASVKSWLAEGMQCRTEDLPPRLQSRWIDATELPARALSAQEISAAAYAEARHFQEVFGTDPLVGVPPTFIWNDAVEAAWARGGVQFVVTPGRRYETRDANDELVGSGATILNGDRSMAGITYLVRDRYFEPARGHLAARGLAALAEKTRLGRPTLLEMHRQNFLSSAENAEISLRELGLLYAGAVQSFPGVLFLSTGQLGLRLRERDPELIERRWMSRVHVWLGRLWQLSSIRRLACVSGIILPALLLYLLTKVTQQAPR